MCESTLEKLEGLYPPDYRNTSEQLGYVTKTIVFPSCQQHHAQYEMGRSQSPRSTKQLFKEEVFRRLTHSEFFKKINEHRQRAQSSPSWEIVFANNSIILLPEAISHSEEDPRTDYFQLYLPITYSS